MTIGDIRERMRVLLAQAGRQENAAEALARRVNRCLLLFDDCLFDLTSGDSVNVDSAQEASCIAEAAAGLPAINSGDCLLLLLPPAEFLVSDVNMPGLTPESMRAALQLQAMTQLPELDQDLSLALTQAGAQSLAWWIRSERTQALYHAFAAQSLFLAAVLPRPVWLLANSSPGRLLLQDADRQMLTLLYHDGGLGNSSDAPSPGNEALRCLQTARQDLHNPDILAHWQQEAADLVANSAANPDLRLTEINSGKDFLRVLRQQSVTALNTRVIAGAAFPPAALSARHQLDRGRRRALVLKGVAVALALLTLPFVFQSWQLNRLEGQLAQIREVSAAARQDQAAVREFETQWGVMTEFPEQDLTAVLLALQEVVNPGVLSVFEIEQGLISIEGESPDPQNVLELLEQNPLFTEVDFARAISNNRYAIDLRLTTVNFPAYRQWHFPERP